ncbi:MAG: RuBisCO large subunit C-terminal-like domain-containing protein [Nitrososphaerales archaeon]
MPEIEKRWTAPSVQHSRGDIFSTTPDKIDPDKNVLATFFITCDPRMSIDHAGVIIAAEQSVGTFTDVSTATDLSTKTAAKLYSWKYEDPSGTVKHSGWVKVAFPTYLLDLDNRGIPDLFTFITGNWMGFTPIPNCKWIDLQLPKDILKLFKGPKFGTEGLREIVGTTATRRPHIGITIKPKMGVTDEGAAKQFYDAALGGGDTFKDDETYHNQWCSPLMDRISKVYEGLDKARSEGAHPEGDMIYVPQVTVDSEKSLEVADRMIAHGARGLMLNFMCTWYPALRALAEDPSINVPIHLHRASHAALTRHPRHGISLSVTDYLARLAGGDLVHVGTSRGKLGDQSKFVEIPEIMKTIQDPLGHIKPMIGVASGGLTPQNYHFSIDLMGNDIQLQNGGGVHGHPWGTKSGAMAARQAVDAYLKKIPVEEYAKDHPELLAAIQLWGQKYALASEETVVPELGTKEKDPRKMFTSE